MLEELEAPTSFVTDRLMGETVAGVLADKCHVCSTVLAYANFRQKIINARQYSPSDLAPVQARQTLLVQEGHFWIVIPKQRLHYIDSNDMARACWRQYSMAPHYKRAVSPKPDNSGDWGRLKLRRVCRVLRDLKSRSTVLCPN